jgi:hypothetical protein
MKENGGGTKIEDYFDGVLLLVLVPKTFKTMAVARCNLYHYVIPSHKKINSARLTVSS